MNWISLLVPGITAFFGSGIATAWVTHNLTIQRAREELLRSKLEDLFIATNRFLTQAWVAWIPYLGAMEGKYSYDEARDISMETLKAPERNLENMQMLINLYFPDFIDLLNSLIEARDDVGRLKRAFKENYRDGKNPPEDTKRFKEALIVFDETGKMLLLMLTGTSKSLRKPPSFFGRMIKIFPKRKDNLKDLRKSGINN
jgi:hypothetical protein